MWSEEEEELKSQIENAVGEAIGMGVEGRWWIEIADCKRKEGRGGKRLEQGWMEEVGLK